jgi:hypothetical protein
VANRGRVGKFPQDIVGNQGLPLGVVCHKRLDMLLQTEAGDRHGFLV